MGANTALRDSCELGIALSKGSKEGAAGLQQILREYERKMIPRGREHVLLSRTDAEADDHIDLSGGRLEKQAEAKRGEKANGENVA